MAFPSIASYANTTSGGNTVSTLNCTLPSGTVEDSILVIIVGNDDTAAANFTMGANYDLEAYSGDGTSDAQLAFFTGLASATDISNGYVTVDWDGGVNEHWASVLRIAGGNPASITDGTTRSGYTTATATYESPPGSGLNLAYQLSTSPDSTENNVLFIAAIAFDGGDAHPWTYQGTEPNWTTIVSVASGTGGNDACGAWGATESADGSRPTFVYFEPDGNTEDGAALISIVISSQPILETDAESDGTSVVTGVSGSVVKKVDADTAGSSTAQTLVTFSNPNWWSWDADHFTFDSNDGTHTMDGFHIDVSGSETVANAYGTSTAQADVLPRPELADAYAAGTSTAQADATPRYEGTDADSVGTSVATGRAAFILNISKGEGSGTARPKLIQEFYFDASDSVITDDTNAWANDALAFDGDTNTYAEISGTFTNQNKLSAIGTTADPTWDWKIIEVLFDFYTSGSSSALWTVSCDIDGNFVSFGYDSHEEPGWHNYPDEYSLPTPGYFEPPNDFQKWTWPNVARLELLANIDATSGWYRLHAGKVIVTYRGEIDFGSSKIKASKAQADGDSSAQAETAIVYAPDIDVTGVSVVSGNAAVWFPTIFTATGTSEVLGEAVDAQSPYDETDADAVGESVALAITGAIKGSEGAVVATSATDGLVSVIIESVAAAQATSVTSGETALLGQGDIEADGTSASLAEANAVWLTDTSAIAEATASADSGALFLTDFAVAGTSVVTGAAEDIGLVLLEQEGYRFRNDDGTEITATWAAAQDNDITTAKEVRKRIRVLTDTTGNAPSQQVTLQYREVGGPSDSWRDV